MHAFLPTTLIGFTSGIFFHSFFDFGYWWSFFFLLLGSILFSYEKWFVEVKLPVIIAVAVFLFAVGVVLVRYDVSLFNNGDPVLENVIGKQVILRGMVTDEPDIRENNMHLTIAVNSTKEGDRWRSVQTKTLVIMPFFLEFQYGDVVELSGVFKKPENFLNENGREFDYISYLAKDGIFYQ